MKLATRLAISFCFLATIASAQPAGGPPAYRPLAYSVLLRRRNNKRPPLPVARRK